MMNLTEYRRTASRLADYLPWATLVGSGVVLNKDGSFQRTAKFRGPDLDSAVAAELARGYIGGIGGADMIGIGAVHAHTLVAVDRPVGSFRVAKPECRIR